MSRTTPRTVSSISCSTPGAQLPSTSMMPLPRISPASTTRLVVVRVSQATRASGSLDRNRSTMVSEMRSETLSGCPSETLSEVKWKEVRDKGRTPRGHGRQGWAAKHIKICLYVQAVSWGEQQGRDQRQRRRLDRHTPQERRHAC